MCGKLFGIPAMNYMNVQTAEFCTSIPTFPAPAMSSQEAEGWAQGSGPEESDGSPLGTRVPVAMVGTEDICVAAIDIVSFHGRRQGGAATTWFFRGRLGIRSALMKELLHVPNQPSLAGPRPRPGEAELKKTAAASS